jgi:hypothetical protein
MGGNLEQLQRTLRWRQQSFATGHGSGHGASLRLTKTLHAFEGHETMKQVHHFMAPDAVNTPGVFRGKPTTAGAPLALHTNIT